MKRLIAPLFGGIFLLLASQAQAALVTTGYYLNTNTDTPAFLGTVASAELGAGSFGAVGDSTLTFGAPEAWGSIATDGSRLFFMNTFVDGPFFLGNIVETTMAGDFVADIGSSQTLFGSPEDWTRFAYANDQFYFLNTAPFANEDPAAGPVFRGKIVVTDTSLNPVDEIFVSFANNLLFGDPDLDGAGNSDGIRDNDGATGISFETGFGTDGNFLYFLNSQGGGEIIQVNMDGTGAVSTGLYSPFGSPEDWTGFAIAQVDVVDVPEIPLPGAVWLFGSGLVFLGGLSLRRRKSA